VRNGQTFLNGLPVNGTTTNRPRQISVISLVTTGDTSADRFGTAPGGSYAPWWGDLAELIVYDRPLTTDERAAVEGYLRTRYWYLSATPGVDSVALSWPARPGAVRYDVERSTVSGSEFASVATGLTGTAYLDSNVQAPTTYFYRVVAVDDSGNRVATREVAAQPLVAGTGAGLSGTYYNTIDLSGSPSVARVDPSVDVNFGTGSPDPALGADNFSVRWTGQVQAPLTGNFVFAAHSDDGVRLRVNGQLVIDNWTDHGDTLNTSPPIHLEAGQKYDISLEYYEHAGGALVRLQWSYPGQDVQTIPQAYLYP
jgi:hypothetical protein